MPDIHPLAQTRVGKGKETEMYFEVHTSQFPQRGDTAPLHPCEQYSPPQPSQDPTVESTPPLLPRASFFFFKTVSQPIIICNPSSILSFLGGRAESQIPETHLQSPLKPIHNQTIHPRPLCPFCFPLRIITTGRISPESSARGARSAIKVDAGCGIKGAEKLCCGAALHGLRTEDAEGAAEEEDGRRGRGREGGIGSHALGMWKSVEGG